jgi:SNF2 family DNA or RNA helicase
MTNVYGEIDGENIILNLPEADDWVLSRVADLLHTMTPLVSFTPEGAPSIPLSWVTVTQLSHLFTGKPDYSGQALQWVPGTDLSRWIIEEVVRRSCQGDLLADKPKRAPMTHQSAGALAIGMNGRFLLADEPGTGKTTTALMGLSEMSKRGRDPWPAFVVCPASVVDPWLEELELVYPMWRARAYRGPKRHSFLGGADLYIMSYETMRNDVGDSKKPGPLMKAGAHTLIFDEAHKLCNYDSQQSIRARRLAKHTPNVICATGTPITKNVGNFWPIVNSMYPESYPSRDRYKGRYCLMRSQGDAGYGEQEVAGLDPAREPEFRIVMQGTMRRVAKADVLTELPPKTYQTRWIEIPKAYRPSYDEMEADMLAHLPDVETPLTAMSTLAKMMRLSQLAHSACDVEVVTEIDTKEGSDTFGEEVERIIVHPKEPCWKGDALLEILDELHQGGYQLGARPVVAFAPLKKLVMLAADMAERKGYKVGYIVGGMTNTQRTEARLAFQNNELDLLAVTSGAGGVGLTLTAADTAVFLMRPWSYVEASQCEDRIHRRGQLQNCMIIDLVARNTIESRIRSALRDKAANLSDLVQDRRIVEGFLGGK